MASKKPNNKSKQLIDQFEALKDTPRGFVRSVVNDVGQQGASSLWEQMFGKYEEKPQVKDSGDLAEGEELDIKSLKKKEKAKKLNAEPGTNYISEIIHGAKRTEQKIKYETETKIEEIKIEIKKLAESYQELKTQFKGATQEQRITRAGKYHLSFFEWMLNSVREARSRVEDAGAWLKAMKCKKGKQGYWEQFKKKGTSFGLSNERVVATQTG